MKPQKILVPIDLRHFSPEIYEVINDLARNSSPKVVLLHVIHLNIQAPEARIYEELGREAYWHLNSLSSFVAPNASIEIRVRFGRVTQEILAEARAEKTDLILLSPRQRPFWNWRLTLPWWSRGKPLFGSLAEGLTIGAGCQVLVASVKSTYDCELAWGRPMPAERRMVSPDLESRHRLAGA
jgi:nucleotide-binding universal stress UspA family protein